MSLSGSKKWVNVCKSKSSHGSRKREACHRDIEQHEIKKKKKKRKTELKKIKTGCYQSIQIIILGAA